jgi:hypothetical protein
VLRRLRGKWSPELPEAIFSFLKNTFNCDSQTIGFEDIARLFCHPD